MALSYGSRKFQIPVWKTPSMKLDGAEALFNQIVNKPEIGRYIWQQRSAGIRLDPMARPTEQLVKRQPGDLTHKIPKSNIDNGQSGGRDRKHSRTQPIPDILRQQWIHTGQEWNEVAECFSRVTIRMKRCVVADASDSLGTF